MKHTEIEYKYWADDLDIISFISRLDKACPNTIDDAEHIYVVSCDDYYTHVEDKYLSSDKQRVLRFRKGNNRKEITVKQKQQENVVRDEINIDVSTSADTDISVFLNMLGYEKSFQVYKEAWIWFIAKEVAISYYTLSLGKSIVEVEAINYRSVKEGKEHIDRYEKLLKLNKLRKEKRSLYEIYIDTEELRKDQEAAFC
jgi:adenylate cyclase class IV